MPVENKEALHQLSKAVNAAFGAKVRAVRRSRDISQVELAARVGLSRVTVATIEGGKQNIQLSQVFLIARALDVPSNELVPTLPEVEQRFARVGAMIANPITASGAIFLEDARALLLQMKEDAHEREAPNKTAD
jgi:transcriptional regulator with XRE-family HTH domain